MKIRPVKSDDIPALQSVLKKTGLFPAEMLPDMLNAFLSGDDDTQKWLTCESNGSLVGFCYAVQEELTDRTWNMLAIALSPDMQGKGMGKALVRRLERDLQQTKQRILIVDTSGTEDFSDTREFYKSCGYIEEATIRDFWGSGDDKVVFWKSL